MMRFFILFFPAKCGQECGQITGIFILLKHDFNGGKRKSVYGKTEQEAKRKRREWKKNVNSSAVLGNDRITVGQPMKRYQKILVRQTEPGYKAKQGRAQGETGPGARRNRARAQGTTGPGARHNRAGYKAKQGPGARQNRAGYKAKQNPGARRNRARVEGETGPDADTGITGKDPLRRKAAKNAAESLFPLFGGNFPVLLNTELKTGILTGLRRSRGDYDIPLSKATTEKRPAGIDRALFC